MKLKLCSIKTVCTISYTTWKLSHCIRVDTNNFCMCAALLQIVIELLVARVCIKSCSCIGIVVLVTALAASPDNYCSHKLLMVY